ncbi:hypothetical protein GOODEAATRI_011133, partial [Goodea atripinnis]
SGTESMAAPFTIDDAFVLDGDEEEAVSDGDSEGWKSRDKDRDGEMTFGPLTFSKPQTHPSAAATGSPDHSNLKYQVQETRHPSSSRLGVALLISLYLVIPIESGK